MIFRVKRDFIGIGGDANIMTTLQIITIYNELKQAHEEACKRLKECQEKARSDIESIDKWDLREADKQCRNTFDALDAFQNHNWS